MNVLHKLHSLLHGRGAASPSSETRDDEDYKLAASETGVDRTWYLETYPDIASAGVDPVEHYLRHGWREGRDPRPSFSTSGYLAVNEGVEGNPLLHFLRRGGAKVLPLESEFDADYDVASADGGVDRTWYLETYPDIASAGVDPVEHYLRHGWREGRDPRPSFSTSGYLAVNEGVEGNPLLHFLRRGGAKVLPLESEFDADYDVASADGGVDRTWYLETYPDIASAGVDPVEHYLRHGWREGRDPRPSFSTSGYLAVNEGVEGNPLLHFLRRGGAKVLPLESEFDADYDVASADGGVDRTWYLETYPDIASAGVDPVEHYLRHGWREGRDPRPSFSTSGYLAVNEGVEGNPLLHFLRHGGAKVLPLESEFDADYDVASADGGVDRTWYLETYPDIASAGVDPVEHYLRHGWREGRDPRPSFSTSGYLAVNEGVEGNPL